MLAEDSADLVVIVTPPQRHAYIAEQALVRGKHIVICGIPTLSEDDMTKLLSVHSGDTLAIFDWGLRFHPAFIKMKQLIETDYCGTLQILHAKIDMSSLLKSGKYSWQCDEALGGGALSCLGTQMIDILHYVTGQQAQEVMCSQHTFTQEMDAIKGFRKITSDDYCTMNLKFPDGMVGTIILNTRSSGFSQEIGVFGSAGRLEVTTALDDVHTGTTLFGYPAGKKHILYTEKDLPEMNPHAIGTRRLYGRLKRAFDSGEETSWASLVDRAATLDDGYYVQSVISAARRSSRNGHSAETIQYSLD